MITHIYNLDIFDCIHVCMLVSIVMMADLSKHVQ